MKAPQLSLFFIGNILLTLSLILSYDVFFNTPTQTQELRESTKYLYINPLLECNVEFEYYNPKNLQSTLETYIEETIQNTGVSQISYYARLLKGGATFGYEENTEYIPASLIKLPLAIAFLKHTSLSQLTQKTTVEEKMSDIQERNFGADTIEVGKTYSFGELIEAMLRHSDNIAALEVIKSLGVDPIYTVYREFGLENIDFTDLGSIAISAKSYASFFRMLYNASYIPREDSEYILSLLTLGDFKTGIAHLLPAGVVVANKFGERKNPLNNETQLHDCGIIYAKETPYVLCIMTRGNNFEDQLQAIQEMSKTIYDTVTSI